MPKNVRDQHLQHVIVDEELAHFISASAADRTDDSDERIIEPPLFFSFDEKTTPLNVTVVPDGDLEEVSLRLAQRG